VRSRVIPFHLLPDKYGSNPDLEPFLSILGNHDSFMLFLPLHSEVFPTLISDLESSDLRVVGGFLILLTFQLPLHDQVGPIYFLSLN